MLLSREFTIGPQEVVAFADLVGDHNPIHLDAEFAADTRYKVPICHGLLLTSLISGCLVEAFGQGTVYLEQGVKFKRPVPVGSTVRVVLDQPESGEKETLRVSTFIEMRQGSLWKKAIEGFAVVLPGRRSAT